MTKKSSISETIRTIADQLQQETKIQIKATSHILAAAAQIAENHDQLIDEVVDVVMEDLDKESPETQIVYTINDLKQQYQKLRNAKSALGIKANSWQSLVDKLNSKVKLENQNNSISEPSLSNLSQRLLRIENEIKMIHLEINSLVVLVNQIIDNEQK
ncbi:hypothetical protein [Cyanothece sp. BG0011]|uniref:hypothetical protein n=1 Tax=Cyanothece sp. BG0011 TaxID=2082950 RepID=UPI000D1DECF4|nr:hypothetical protein [Cyanothece sp. BG0011]